MTIDSKRSRSGWLAESSRGGRLVIAAANRDPGAREVLADWIATEFLDVRAEVTIKPVDLVEFAAEVS